jgi:prefoldin alpha subunit
MQKELQEKVIAYRILEVRLNSLLRQRDLVASKILELQGTLASIDEIEKSEEVLFPLGSDAYTFGKITEKNKIIVEIGANVALEKSIEESKELLKKRKAELENVLNETQKAISETSSALSSLSEEIQKLSTSEKNV